MTITIVYPLDHLTPDPWSIDRADYRRRFLDEVGGQASDVLVGLEKRHELTQLGPAEWWSVVVSGCLS